ncbi:MAG: fibronectin type III domain-containing protein, partial [Planctomycetia bacterium]|nr:fibronectin type III domain-containing protein [Planctomycetia bacterium]
MGKKSLWERIFGGSHSPKGLTRRGLKVENLEDRQLLSAVGWEVTPAYTTDLALETSTVKASLTLEEADTVPDQIRVQIFLNGTAFQEFADGKYATTTDAEAVVGDGGLDGDTTTTDYYEFTVDNPGTWAVGENDVIIQDLFGADVNLSQVGFTVLAKDEIPDTVTSPVHFHVKAQAIVWDPASETEIDITPAGVENIALTQLPAPEILDQYVSGSSSNIMIQWSPVTDAAGYEYRYKLNTEGETEWSAPISSGSVEGEPNTYAMVNSLTANTKYDFQLRSVGDAAHETSEWSALKSYTTRPLATPTITVNSRTADDINISWVTDPNAASYTVTAILPDGITYGTNTNATQTDGSFSLKGNLFNAEGNDFVLTPGTTYSIQLSAVPAVPSEYLSSGSSDEATTKTPLAVPTNLGSTAHTDTTVTLSWEAVTNAA